MNKICVICGTEFETKHSRKNTCSKSCNKKQTQERQKKYREEETEEKRNKRLIKKKEYRQKNKHKIITYARKYTPQYRKRDYVIEARKKEHNKYHKENKDKILLRQLQYREENKDKLIEARKEYNMKDKDKKLLKQRKYREENKDIFNLKRRIYRNYGITIPKEILESNPEKFEKMVKDAQEYKQFTRNEVIE